MLIAPSLPPGYKNVWIGSRAMAGASYGPGLFIAYVGFLCVPVDDIGPWGTA